MKQTLNTFFRSIYNSFFCYNAFNVFNWCYVKCWIQCFAFFWAYSYFFKFSIRPAKHMMDFVFIDDRHSYGHMRRELELIGDHVGPSSVVLLHDLMYEAHAPFYHSDASLPENHLYGAGGPYRAVAELDTTVWEWATLPWGHGLTLLRRK